VKREGPRASSRKRHSGVDFAIWRHDSSWLWLVFDRHSKGGTIGATTKEAGAIREACSAIEAILRVS
jgi:hypothetical protein